MTGRDPDQLGEFVMGCDLNSEFIILFLFYFSTLDFTESYMVDYCLKRPSHQVDGKVLTVTRAEPEFEEENFDGNDEENGNEETEEDCDNVAKAMDDVD